MNVLGNRWTFAVPYIEMKFGSRVLASGSAFFWKHNKRGFLASNWHNFSGRDPQTRQPLSKNGGIPSHVVFHSFRQQTPPDASGNFVMSQVSIPVQLCDD